MKNQFVTYEIALNLKELGFDEECIYQFMISSKEINPVVDYNGYPIYRNNTAITKCSTNTCIAAPLWQQSIDWLREKHGIWISISVEIYTLKHSYDIFCPNEKDGDPLIVVYKDNSDEWDLSYEEAREKAIFKAIELCQKQ